jgi:hypothetical protein
MIAIVIPTIRPQSFENYYKGWEELFKKHNVEVVVVDDTQDKPRVFHGEHTFSLKEIMGKDSDLISNKCAAVRNLGFAYVQKYLKDVKYIITMDDDMMPSGDTIQDHINQLVREAPTSWFPVSEVHNRDDYTRGFPYGIREESPVMLSHGVWEKNPDYDAPTQLVKGNVEMNYLKCVVPKGLFFPFCGMNVGFRVEALPYVYYAPVRDFKGAERFDDIWAGLEIKKSFDENGWAIATGYASCIHTRESNVLFNLEKEAVGLRKNEEYWKGQEDAWYKDYLTKRERWKNRLLT